MNLGEHSTKSITRYFFDTYALIEIRKGNDAYAKYLDVSFFLTKFNLFEYHQYLLRAGREAEADEETEGFLPQVVEFGIEVIEKASRLREKHHDKNLSMTDCIGYVYAKENSLVFVTGDREMKDWDNAEFGT